jgi:hypothetical protein
MLACMLVYVRMILEVGYWNACVYACLSDVFSCQIEDVSDVFSCQIEDVSDVFSCQIEEFAQTARHW